MSNIFVKSVFGIVSLIAFNVYLYSCGQSNTVVSFIVGALIGTVIGLSEG